MSAEGIKDLEALLWETPEETKAQKTMKEVNVSTVKGEITEKRRALGSHDLCGPESDQKRKGAKTTDQAATTTTTEDQTMLLSLTTQDLFEIHGGGGRDKT